MYGLQSCGREALEATCESFEGVINRRVLSCPPTAADHLPASTIKQFSQSIQ